MINFLIGCVVGGAVMTLVGPKIITWIKAITTKTPPSVPPVVPPKV